MSAFRTVLPVPNWLDLIGIRATENAIILDARTASRVARCPECGKKSTRVHSSYTGDVGMDNRFISPGAIGHNKLLAPKLQEGQIVVMDNLGAHRPERVRELIEPKD